MDRKEKQNLNSQLFEILNNTVFTAEFISGIAGDSALSASDRKIFDKLLEETGDDFYVKILFYITHQVFSKEDSRQLWKDILKHKLLLSKKLNRNVEITVATLDYLTNIKDRIVNPKLVGEAFIGKIAEISSIDPLTKLYNRPYLFTKISEEFTRYKRYGAAFSFIILDIDFFKKVNDKYGHQKGDDVLSKLGYILNRFKRELDICARYGGEEFSIVLPHTDGKEALILSKRLLKNIEDHFKDDVQITVSIGASNCPDSSKTVKGLIKRADEALYEAKRLGRNRVVFN